MSVFYKLKGVGGGGVIPVDKKIWSEFGIFWKAFDNIKLTIKGILRLELSQNKSKVVNILGSCVMCHVSFYVI